MRIVRNTWCTGCGEQRTVLVESGKGSRRCEGCLKGEIVWFSQPIFKNASENIKRATDGLIFLVKESFSLKEKRCI